MNKKYRRVIIAGNWKMNMLPSQVRPFLDSLKNALPENANGCGVVLCVPATHLAFMGREKYRRIGIAGVEFTEPAAPPPPPPAKSVTCNTPETAPETAAAFDSFMRTRRPEEWEE